MNNTQINQILFYSNNNISCLMTIIITFIPLKALNAQHSHSRIVSDQGPQVLLFRIPPAYPSENCYRHDIVLIYVVPCDKLYVIWTSPRTRKIWFGTKVQTSINCQGSNTQIALTTTTQLAVRLLCEMRFTLTESNYNGTK